MKTETKNKIIDTITALFKPRTLFTALFFVVTCYMCVKKIPIPEILKTTDIALISFYFGEKTGKYLNGNSEKK